MKKISIEAIVTEIMAGEGNETHRQMAATRALLAVQKLMEGDESITITKDTKFSGAWVRQMFCSSFESPV